MFVDVYFGFREPKVLVCFCASVLQSFSCKTCLDIVVLIYNAYESSHFLYHFWKISGGGATKFYLRNIHHTNHFKLVSNIYPVFSNWLPPSTPGALN